MKNQIILDLEDVLNTYKSKMPKRAFKTLKLRKYAPLIQDSLTARNSAFLIGKIMGDGNLDPLFTCRFIGQYGELAKLRGLITNNFSIKPESITLRYRENIGISYLLQVNDALFGRFLNSIGAPMGNKTKTEFLVPKWIIESRICKKYFLKGIFDDELATIKIKREKYIREATFRIAKIEKYQENLYKFLSEIKTLVECFSVECGPISKPHFENVQKDGSKTFSLLFRILGNKNNIIRFNEKIGFGYNTSKIYELKKCVNLIKDAEARIRT